MVVITAPVINLMLSGDVSGIPLFAFYKLIWNIIWDNDFNMYNTESYQKYYKRN